MATSFISGAKNEKKLIHVILVHFVVGVRAPIFAFYYFCHAVDNWFKGLTVFVAIDYNQMRQTCSLQAIALCSETILYPSSLTTEDNLSSVL